MEKNHRHKKHRKTKLSNFEVLKVKTVPNALSKHHKKQRNMEEHI